MIIEQGSIGAARLYAKIGEMLNENMPAEAANISTDIRAKLVRLCELVDVLNDEEGVEQVAVAYEKNPSLISFIIDVDELVFQNGRAHSFFEYIKSANVMSFSKSSNDGISVKLGVVL